jgi:hypothetical protein
MVVVSDRKGTCSGRIPKGIWAVKAAAWRGAFCIYLTYFPQAS